MATLNVNGKVQQFQAEDDTPLLWVLREQLGLTGTKYGCGIAQCGACTVHIDGVPTRSCVRPAATVGANEKIVTIEGLSPDGSHPPESRSQKQGPPPPHPPPTTSTFPSCVPSSASLQLKTRCGKSCRKKSGRPA